MGMPVPHDRMKHIFPISLTALICFIACGASFAGDTPPGIVKKGTIAVDIVETSPVVFNGRLYRFEYIRSWIPSNTSGKNYFQFVDVESGDVSEPFAEGYMLGSAFVENETVYVPCVNKWGGDTIFLLESTDMRNWESRTVIELPGWKIYNTSLCRGSDEYTLVFEIGAPPEIAGNRFSNAFLTSPDLTSWKLLPAEYVFTPDRYSACPDLHYSDGYYYMVYLEAYPVPTEVHASWPEYAPHIVRSKDLRSFEQSPFNPIFRFSADDKIIADDILDEAQREKIRSAVNLNNSDIGMCEFDGRVVIYYSWGDQHGSEFLAEAYHTGTLRDFLAGFFPDE